MDAAGIRYALIGGFAMALRGVQRATVDLDFIIMLEDLEKADAIFVEAGYERAFHNENVSHYLSDQSEMGRINILHAFRGPTLKMLEQADRLQIDSDHTLPVIKIEDIIGLKIQATVNDPQRKTRDYADIRMMLETSAEMEQILDWELIEDYLELFNLRDFLGEMKSWYGPIDGNRP